MRYFGPALQAAKLNLVAAAERPSRGHRAQQQLEEVQEVKVKGGEPLYFRGHRFGTAVGRAYSFLCEPCPAQGMPQFPTHI